VISALPPKEPRWKGAGAEIADAFLKEFQSIRDNGRRGREQRAQLVADLRYAVLKDPRADIKPLVYVDAEDLGLLQDIHPDDLSRGEPAPPEMNEQFRKLNGIPDEYYIGPGGVVRVKSSELRPNPNPVAGVIASLRAFKMFGNEFLENFDVNGPPVQ
jgi:hypothetical protein